MIFLKGKKRGLVVVSNRLPLCRVRNKRTGSFTWEKTAGGLITAMEPILRDAGGVWLGWDGWPVEKAVHKSLKLFDVKSLNPDAGPEEESYRIGCVPLTKLEFEEYYNNFSNGTLWALFHYFFERSFIDYSSWKTYIEVNRRFAAYIDRVAAKDDIVWVQDFHLFLVPHYLRQLRPLQEIHFFLHIPFPNIDIFSILPWQDKIIESLLACNTVGFHHKQYYRNFLGAVTLYRSEKERIPKRTAAKGIKTHFYVNPISIDFDLLDRTSRLGGVIERKNQILKQAACPKLIVGVDRIDYSKGIKERLLGLELMLKNHPELKESFFYYQLVIPSREAVGTYIKLKRQIDEIIGRINGKYSTGLWAPVHYNYGTVPFNELVALYLAANVALVTPLRDGMNLVCKEYIASHSDGDGVLVLSKFAGAIAEIKNCITVNPYSIEDIAGAIYRALNMPEEERRRRMAKMRANIRTHNIKEWLQNCVGHFGSSI